MNTGFPQPPRVLNWGRHFIPLHSPEHEHINPNVPISLATLCPKCEAIRTWFDIPENMEKVLCPNRYSGTCPICTGTPELLDDGRFMIKGSDSIPMSVPFDHYKTMPEFEKSASQGCHLCTLILDTIIGDHADEACHNRAQHEEELAPPGPITLRFATSPRHGQHNPDRLVYLELEGCEEDARDGVRPRSIEISLSDNVSRDIIPPATALSSTKSQATLDLIDRWLSDCLKSHKHCSSTRPRSVPTRLLRISTSATTGDVEDDLVVSLVEIKGIPHEEHGLKYATLSYCWGGEAPFSLTSKTWRDLNKGVQVSRLSQTIQDAIWMANELGLEYIWIDSLCIIQDSPKDWEREALRMCSVYRDSFVTFAARGASSAKEGLFARRDPLQYASCVPGRGDEAKYVAADSAYRTRYAVHRWPLDKRAWVAQERLLASRTINFGPFVSWICEEGCHSEFGVDETGRLTREEHLKWKFSQIVLQPPPSSQKQQRENSLVLYQLWMDIVLDYCESHLTVKTDKLVALSGIITAFESHTGWKNIAGCWFHSPFIMGDLLWSGGGSPPCKRTGLRPTWSWISMDGGVRLAYPSSRVPPRQPRYEGGDQAYPGSEAIVAHWPEGEIQPALKVRSALLRTELITTNSEAFGRRVVRSWDGKLEVTISVGAEAAEGLDAEEKLFLPLRITPSYEQIQGLTVVRSKDHPEYFERLHRRIFPVFQNVPINQLSWIREAFGSMEEDIILI